MVAWPYRNHCCHATVMFGRKNSNKKYKRIWGKIKLEGEDSRELQNYTLILIDNMCYFVLRIIRMYTFVHCIALKAFFNVILFFLICRKQTLKTKFHLSVILRTRAINICRAATLSILVLGLRCFILIISSI